MFYGKKPKLSQWPYLWYTRFWTHALTKPISTSASADTLATWLHPSICGMICFDVRSQSLVHSAMAEPVTQTTGTSQSATAGGSVRLKTTFKSRQFLSTVIKAALVSLSWFSGMVTLQSKKNYRLLFHNWRSHWMESSVTKGQCFARKANKFFLTRKSRGKSFGGHTWLKTLSKRLTRRGVFSSLDRNSSCSSRLRRNSDNFFSGASNWTVLDQG